MRLELELNSNATSTPCKGRNGPSISSSRSETESRRRPKPEFHVQIVTRVPARKCFIHPCVAQLAESACLGSRRPAVQIRPHGPPAPKRCERAKRARRTQASERSEQSEPSSDGNSKSESRVGDTASEASGERPQGARRWWGGTRWALPSGGEGCGHPSPKKKTRSSSGPGRLVFNQDNVGSNPSRVANASVV